MSSDLFHTARVKVRRARKHTDDIAHELARVAVEYDRFFRASSAANPFGFGHTIVEFPIATAALDQVACCVGDAAHNLRAALDLMACEVVERSGYSPKDVHFPFAQTEAELTSPNGGMLKRKKFNRARADAQALHLSLGAHGEPHGDRLLWALHRLDLIDKHQDLLALAHDIPTPALYVHGARLPRIGDAPARLVFAKGFLLEGEEVISNLNAMAGLVEQIIDKFDSLFR